MEIMKLSPKQKTAYPWREIDGHTVVIQTDAGSVHELDEVGGYLWQHADGTRTLEEIVSGVVESFDVEKSRAWSDATEFYSELRDLGLIEF